MCEKNITCIVCPSSCQITVKGTGNQIESITGYECKRGLEYATAEYLNPQRQLTAIVKASGYKTPTVSVRTSKPIPKDMQMEVMKILKETVAEPPFNVGRVVIENILDTGSDIIMTNN